MNNKHLVGCVVCNIKKVSAGNFFCLVKYDIESPEKAQFMQKTVEESQLAALMAKGFTADNIKLEGGKVKGKFASLDRFQSNPIVIISELRVKTEGSDTSSLAGYRVVNGQGQIKVIKKDSLIKACLDYKKANKLEDVTLIQNAQFVEKDGTYFIRSYKGDEFNVELIIRNKTKAAEQAEKSVEAVKKSIENKSESEIVAKLKRVYTDAQIKEIMLAFRHKADVAIIRNPKLSAEQMRELRLLMEKTNNNKQVAILSSVDYKVKAIKVYGLEIQNGVDIGSFASPEYNEQQIFVLSLGYQDGLDISKYSNPKNTAEEMEQARLRLADGFYREYPSIAEIKESL